MSVSADVGLRLRAARKAADFRTACSFAKQYNIPISTYAQHENGKRVLNADSLLFYSDILGVDVGWLLSGKGKPFPHGLDYADRTAVVARELYTLESSTTTETNLLPIEGGVSLVDVDLLRDVMTHFVALLKEVPVATDNADLVAFALEIYNGVVMTSATADDRSAMIQLSVSSLKRGVSQPVSLIEDRDKVSA
jgi:transcriptional regulator with XRE-family HTH domain